MSADEEEPDEDDDEDDEAVGLVPLPDLVCVTVSTTTWSSKEMPWLMLD